MQREIKFRVWDKAENEFSDISEYDSKHWFDRFRDNNFPESLTIQQYTGLKDKSGVDIYEGDIIKVGFGEYQGSFGEVIFKYGGFRLTTKSGYHFMDTYKLCIYGEVIGNIFENPELLK